jgi:ABC-type polysaccharide/polyol phosphate transport system ATPase subunit
VSAAIDFRDVSVCYRMPDRRVTSLKEWAIRRLSSRVGWHELRALSGVSFSVPEGRALGVVGPNGAGKSTLLRIAGGVLAPTAGEAVIRGRVAPIIELGTGFELELSGRENVYFNGALLGRSPHEMHERFDDIVDFSGLHEFIDAPIRTYSTGMVARLAFAIATTVDAHILLLDEVLAVGDESFRGKCEERIASFRDRGVTILLVSHDLDAVASICDDALWLERGAARALGPAAEVIARYRTAVGEEQAAAEPERAIDGGLVPPETGAPRSSGGGG